mgnify:FL=1
MDILESDPNLGALLRRGTLADFVKARITGQISFHSMVVCDMSRAGQRMRMVDYAIAQGSSYHAEYMIKNGAPLTLDLNDELARDNSGTIEGNWYTTLGYAIHHSSNSFCTLLSHRGDEIDVTRAAVFTGPSPLRTDVCRVYTGLQYALMHGQSDVLLYLLRHQTIPSRLLRPEIVAMYSKGSMFDYQHKKCAELATSYHRKAKRREEGARAALWCCAKGMGSAWNDVWFHLVPHMALSRVQYHDEEEQDEKKMSGRKMKRQRVNE